MKDPILIHDTITIERTINASTQQVFNAWADPTARSQWGPPSEDEAIEFLENDFRVGGRDISVCGQKGNLRLRLETVYHDIQEPLCILFTERVSTDNNLLSVSLVTTQFLEAGEVTKLSLTVQVVSLVGEEMIAGNRGGWGAALANLEGYLKKFAIDQ